MTGDVEVACGLVMDVLVDVIFECYQWLLVWFGLCIEVEVADL